MKYTFDKVTRIIIAAVVIIAIILLVNRLSSVLLPFLIGWLIAYLMHPLVNFIQYKMRVRKRGISIAIALITVIAALAAIICAVVPAVGHEISNASQLVAEYTGKISKTDKLPAAINSLFEYLASQVDLKEVFSLKNIEEMGQKILPQVWNFISNTWQLIVATFVVFVVFMYVIFILLDYNSISDGFIKMIPTKYAHYVSDILEDLEIGMNKYFRGQILIASIVGLLFAIGFKIIGLPLGVTIGIFIGILNIVPYLQTLGLIPVPFLALLQCMETGQNYWFVLLMCFIVFIIVQGLQDMVLVPRIMGKAMGLNPAIILLSLSIWGSLIGLAGMIIALPFTTILLSYYKRYILKQPNVAFQEDENKLPSEPIEERENQDFIS